jgi:peptidoglycan/LPS O-acetylase OafA/YrhL
MSTDSNVNQNHFYSIDSIRFFAAMGIVLYHIRFTMPAFFAKYYFDKFSLCFVALFFVQSGFVLTCVYQNRARVNLRAFYISRFARIYPLHLLTFFVCAIYLFPIWPITLKEKIIIGLANLTLTHTLFPSLKFSLGYNAVSWFLADMAICYLLFPLLLKKKRIAIFSLFIVLGYLVNEIIFKFQGPVNAVYPNFDFFSPLVHIAEFSAGILAALLFLNRTTSGKNTVVENILLIAVILPILPLHLRFLSSQTGLQIYYLLMLPIFTYVFAYEQGAISKYLAGQKALAFLGRASFSLYMWHHLIMRYLGNKFPPDTKPFFAIMSALIISMVIAVISYKYLECPLRALIVKSFSRKNIRNTVPVT